MEKNNSWHYLKPLALAWIVLSIAYLGVTNKNYFTYTEDLKIPDIKIDRLYDIKEINGIYEVIGNDPQMLIVFPEREVLNVSFDWLHESSSYMFKFYWQGVESPMSEERTVYYMKMGHKGRYEFNIPARVPLVALRIDPELSVGKSFQIGNITINNRPEFDIPYKVILAIFLCMNLLYLLLYRNRLSDIGAGETGNIRELPDIIMLSLTIVWILAILPNNIGIQLSDEGVLWYGSMMTVNGETPLLNFPSYDPGRYYWSGVWMLLTDTGLISLREANAMFQFICLTFGLLALRRVLSSFRMLALAGVILSSWMYLSYKVYDSGLSLVAVFFAVYFMEKPSCRRYFIVGVFLGLAAFFGRNHGFYISLSLLAIIAYQHFKSEKLTDLRKIGTGILGIHVGYSPALFMLVFIPGLYAFLTHQLSNIGLGWFTPSLPIPWLWTLEYSGEPLLEFLSMLSRNVFFTIAPLFYLAFVIHILLLKQGEIAAKRLLIASIFIGIPYLHYSHLRPDAFYIGMGIQPLLVGIVSIPFVYNINRKRAVSSALIFFLLLLSIFGAGYEHPFVKKALAHDDAFISTEVAGDIIWMRKDMALLLNNIKRIVSQRVGTDEEIVILPHWPTAYGVLQRKSPVWDIIAMFPATVENQNIMINTMESEKVNWAILCDFRLFSKEEFRFKYARKVVWQYFQDNFEEVEEYGIGDNCPLLHRKEPL